MSVLDRFRLNGKRIFITGASRGLGREMALALADAGADIVLTGRDASSLNETVADIKNLGQEAIPIQADMSDTNDCQRACELVVERYGPINVLINNVGGRRESIPTEEMSLDTWYKYIDLNLTHVFLCTKLIGGSMIKEGQGGRVINISSINAWNAIRFLQGRHYETAKAAVVQFTRSLAIDWAPHRITVNAICPGLFMTEPNIKWSADNPEEIKSLIDRIPGRETGKPEDLGPLAVYLASDASSYINGASIVIDGGFTC